MTSYDSPPLSPCRGHYVPCKVFMLDDTVLTFDILVSIIGCMTWVIPVIFM